MSRVPMMKSMIQLSVEPSEAEKFIRQMATQGYEVGTETWKLGNGHDYHFKINGKTTIAYAVTIDYGSGKAWVGIRPE
jgi:hypothetical protein